MPTHGEACLKVEGSGHKLYMGNFFSSPAGFDHLYKKSYIVWYSPPQKKEISHSFVPNDQMMNSENCVTSGYEGI
jgi:hypothetical protein